MSRPLLPSVHDVAGTPQFIPAGSSEGPESPDGGPSKPTYAKRGKITIVACMPCRKRKTKCDGKRPSCSQCSSRDSPCQYDMTDDQRKLTYLRDNVEALQEKSNVLESLLRTVQTASEEEASEVYRRLRSGADMNTLAEQVQAGRLLSGVSKQSITSAWSPISPAPYSPPPFDPSASAKVAQYEKLMVTIAEASPEASNEIIQRVRNREDVSSILTAAQLGRLAPQPLISRTTEHPPGLEGEYSMAEQTFGMVKGAEFPKTHVWTSYGTEFLDSQTGGPWTTVTNDQKLIEHLVTLYFTWQHCFFQSFPEKLFRTDMAAGRTKYCSSMLVNAICAAGCFLSNRPEARADRGDGQTLVSSFFDEALRQVNSTEVSSVTMTATLYLLSYVAGTRGRLSSLWSFSGRSALTALDINLHLRRDRRNTSEQTSEEEQNERKARQHAFWGCFHVDQTTSFTLGRPPIININSVTIELPSTDDAEDDEPWLAYETKLDSRPGARATTFRQCAALSRIVNGTILMFFAPRVALSGSQLLADYQKYLDWYTDLPSNVRQARDAPPHVLCLHMYYHTAVLLLFRPFLKAKLTNSDVTPREVCRQAANNISNLWSEHRQLYGLAGIYMFQVHCLLTACTIHIVNVPALSATNYLTEACNIFQDLVDRNEWAQSALVILRSLVEKWDRVLAQEAEEALYRAHERTKQRLAQSVTADDPSQSKAMSSAYENLIATADLTFRVDDRPGPALAPTKRPSMNGPSSQSPMLSQSQKRQRLVMPPESESPATRSSSGSVDPIGRQHKQQSPSSYLYAPLDDQPAPLLAPVHQTKNPPHSRQGQQSSGQTGEGGDELTGIATGLDGLSFGDDWRDPFMGFLGEER